MTAPEPRANRLDDLIQAERDIVARLEHEEAAVDLAALSVVSIAGHEILTLAHGSMMAPSSRILRV